MAADTGVDPTVWKACAGTSVRIPTVDSRVYYFPQGHAEHFSSPPFLSPIASSQPLILCRVAAVRLLANPETDEVFAKIRLVPIDPARDIHALERKLGFSGSGNAEEEDGEVAVVSSYAKVLTASDANNGGGFSVPRTCADLIFPSLNFEADPPVQTLSIRDVRGVAWEFRHIYRGTPRRHLLTTGWSRFVNHKKLVAGDYVVFMKNRRSGELFVGLRRAVRTDANCDGRWNFPVAEDDGIGGGGKEGFSRSGRGMVSSESVVLQAELAARGLAFEVVYYPKRGSADFVVKAETVEESLNVFWTAGMRVKMAVESEDASGVKWFQGTVSSAMVPDNGPWLGSPWRMLQVTWDEAEVLKNVDRLSPWQVTHVVSTPPVPSTFPPAKKMRVPQNLGLRTDGGDLYFPIPGLSNSMGALNPSLMNYNSFPAGMQGARQDPIFGSILSNFTSESNHQMCSDKFFGNMIPKLITVSTELKIGSSQSDDLSPDSQSSVHFFGDELVGKQGCNSSTKVGLASIQLFGKIIHMKDTVESGFDDVGYAEDDGRKMFKETEGVKSPLDLSLTFPNSKLLDGLDVQCQRSSAVEACSL
ncbi:auxin response factor 17-like [Actinidia eriantha]|uniref:auxin response factor 17-like n=1 Tax=Actinidia eriantha TaxID=165200 RepID=UPI00258309E2|nr:auxin response factor 17-like [Actinidia eriantha]XP_057469384.1 auxin response factor 17-like [Actinidia eriantha]